MAISYIFFLRGQPRVTENRRVQKDMDVNNSDSNVLPQHETNAVVLITVSAALACDLTRWFKLPVMSHKLLQTSAAFSEVSRCFEIDMLF